jgi:glycosyltransferase involved in cell wall biosynthesis
LRQLVCHLAEASLDVPFFRNIARSKECSFPVMIGSIAPAGRIQEEMARLRKPTFSLEAIRRAEYPLAILRLVRLLRRMRVSILHGHGFDSTWLGLIASRVARVPFVFTRHHSDHHIRIGKRLHIRVDAWCAKQAAHVIAVSEATRRIMVEIESVPLEKISLVYNGVEPLLEPPAEEVRRIRDELGLAENDRVCLVLARLHEEKGHRFFFGALPEVQRRVGPMVALLAGSGPHRSLLEAEVESRALQGAVRFLGYRDDIATLISIASVVVLPSLAESFGQALTEAMSLGKPVVATTTGGIPEVVVDGETGLLVPPGNSAALAQAICRVIEDAALSRELGEAGRRRAKSFSYVDMLRGYENVYRKVLGIEGGVGKCGPGPRKEIAR